MFAYDFPVLGLFFTMMLVMIWVVWLILLFRVIFDIFRSDDMSGWGKAGWLILVVVLPYLGVLVYVIARGGEMGQRDVERARNQEAALQDYIRTTAGSGGGTADELSKLADLKDRGVISDEEFAQQKARILA